MVSKVSYLFSGPRNRQKRDFPPFSKVNSLLNPYQDYAHLKKHDCLVPTSVSRPSVNRFGSYLVMLQPHIPSGSPGVRNTKNVHRAVYDAVHIKTIFFYFLFLTNLRFFLHFWNLGTSSGVLKQKKSVWCGFRKKVIDQNVFCSALGDSFFQGSHKVGKGAETCFAVPWACPMTKC